jgi:serine/threonine protein kinase
MEGHISIVDFGLSKTNVFDGDKTETFCGSLEYMPPELLAGKIFFFLYYFISFLVFVCY